MRTTPLRAAVLFALASTPALAQSVQKSPFSPPPAMMAKAKVAVVDKPLKDVVDQLAKSGGLEITLDAKSLAEEGIPLDEPVTLDATDVSLESALELLTGPLGLTWDFDGKRVEILSETAAEDRIRAVVYDYSNLRGMTPDLMVNLVERSIGPPQSWTGQGGPGTIRAAGRRIEVRQSGAVHRRIASLLRRLDRVAVGPTKNKPITTELANAALTRKLAGKVSLKLENVPLDKAVLQLAESAEVPFLLDGIALREEGIALDAPVSVTADGPLSEGLDTLLKPLGLTWYVQHEKVHVTSVVVGEESHDVRVYDVSHLLRNGVPAIVDDVTRQIPESWADLGGPGTIVVLGRFAIIGQNPPMHRRLSVLLAPGR